MPPAAEPVEHDRQMDEAAGHRDVGDVHRPHLVGPRDLQVAQQIWIDLVTWLRLRRSRTAIERLYPHPLHQRFHVPAADLASLGSQQASQHCHLQIARRYRTRQIIDTATTDVQSLGLLGD